MSAQERVPTPYLIRNLCEKLVCGANEKGRKRASLKLALATKRFREKIFKDTAQFPIDFDDPLAYECALQFFDCDRERQIFFHGKPGKKNSRLSLPEDREQILGILAKVFCMHERYKRNYTSKKENQVKDSQIDAQSPLKADESLVSELTDVGHEDCDFDEDDRGYHKNRSEGNSEDNCSENNANEDTIIVDANPEYLILKQKPAIIEGKRPTRSPSITLEQVQTEPGTRTQTNVEDYGSRAYPLESPVWSQYDPCDISESPLLESFPSVRWLFEMNKIWPADPQKFLWRLIHDENLYSLFGPSEDKIELCLKRVKEYLGVTCNRTQDRAAMAKIRRFIIDWTQKWRDDNFLEYDISTDKWRRTVQFDESLEHMKLFQAHLDRSPTGQMQRKRKGYLMEHVPNKLHRTEINCSQTGYDISEAINENETMTAFQGTARLRAPVARMIARPNNPEPLGLPRLPHPTACPPTWSHGEQAAASSQSPGISQWPVIGNSYVARPNIQKIPIPPEHSPFTAPQSITERQTLANSSLWPPDGATNGGQFRRPRCIRPGLLGLLDIIGPGSMLLGSGIPTAVTRKEMPTLQGRQVRRGEPLLAPHTCINDMNTSFISAGVPQKQMHHYIAPPVPLERCQEQGRIEGRPCIIEFIPRDNNGQRDFDSPLPSFRASTVAQFFHMFSERSGIAFEFLESINFTVVFDENTQLILKKWDDEQKWQRIKINISDMFKLVKMQNPERMDYKVYVSGEERIVGPGEYRDNLAGWN